MLTIIPASSWAGIFHEKILAIITRIMYYLKPGLHILDYRLISGKGRLFLGFKTNRIPGIDSFILECGPPVTAEEKTYFIHLFNTVQQETLSFPQTFDIFSAYAKNKNQEIDLRHSPFPLQIIIKIIRYFLLSISPPTPSWI